MATEQDEVIAEPKAALPSSVGATLKAARERTGKDLAEVAAQLRIRQPFLSALEDGRHKDLPGGTYAVGFLRTYAEFLNLDGEEMVRRFKQEAAGDLDSRAELIFPSPVSEGRIPGGALLFLGLVLAGAAYGGWYWLSSRDLTVAEMVPPIPERLAPVAKPADPAPAEPKPEEPKPAEDASARPDEAKPTMDAAKPGEVVPPAEAEDDKQPPQPEPAKPVEPASPPPAPVAAKPAEVTKPAEAPKPPEAKPAEPPADAAPPAADPKPAAQDPGGARIVLKASGDDCWVQVREMDGRLLLSRLLRKGDTYAVPDRPGLSLMVGNAGALEISVDGKAVPSLGTTGQVRRDIKLDPEKLAAGG